VREVRCVPDLIDPHHLIDPHDPIDPIDPHDLIRPDPTRSTWHDPRL
jgi:hypothetical protein